MLVQQYPLYRTATSLYKQTFLTPEFQNSIKDCLGYVAKSIYNADNTDHIELIGKLNQLCLDNKENLSKIGLTFDSENKKMSFDNTIDLTTSEFKDAYNRLFGENAAFGNTAAENCKILLMTCFNLKSIGCIHY